MIVDESFSTFHETFVLFRPQGRRDGAMHATKAKQIFKMEVFTKTSKVKCHQEVSDTGAFKLAGL